MTASLPNLSRSGQAAKRVFDVAFAVLAIVLVFPIMVIVAVSIKLDSPGPVIYRGTRTGRFGRRFQIFKFRTMVPNAEVLGGLSTAKDDPRVTRVGRYLRKYKLDELPQFFNVLKGDMSIVGPRPEMPEYTDQYEGDEELILTVRPGITDYASLEFIQLAEVLGSVNADRVYEEQVRPVKNALRVEYVREQSLRNDLTIIAKTLGRLFAVRRSSTEVVSGAFPRTMTE